MYDRESLVPSTGLTIGTVREEAKGPGSNIGDGGRQYCNEAKNEPVTDCTGKTHRHASGGGSDGSSPVSSNCDGDDEHEEQQHQAAAAAAAEEASFTGAALLDCRVAFSLKSLFCSELVQ
jgi:hypothetical protein